MFYLINEQIFVLVSEGQLMVFYVHLGYYMYIETSDPRVAGDKAILEFTVCGNGQLSCLTFYYHMYGDTMGTLTVFSGNMVVFNTSGNHGHTWVEAKRTIYLNKTVSFNK